MIIPRRVHIATQAIAAAATVTPTFFDLPVGTRCVTFFVTYLGDAADSQLDLDIEWSSDLAGTEDARDTVIEGGIDVTQPEGRYDIVQRVRRGPQPGAAATAVYEIAASVPAGARRVRMIATGVGDSGTITVALTGGSQDCPGGSFAVDGTATPSGAIPAPSGFLIERREHLADQTLPGAGAFTSQALETVPAGTKRVAFWITYTRGAAGGFPIFHVEFSNGTETASRDVIIDSASLAITDPNGRFNIPLAEPQGATPSDGNPIEYVLDFDLPPNTVGVRLLVAEAGDTGNPGDIEMGFTGEG